MFSSGYQNVWRTPWASACVLVLLHQPLAARPSEQLPAKIVTNVEASEALYPNVEVKWRKETKANGENKKLSNPPPFIVQTMTERFHSVTQGDKTYVEYACEATNFANETRNARTRHGYDGKIARVDSMTMGHIYHQRLDSGFLFRPHTWPLSSAFVTFPLSSWLRGGEELQKHPTKTHQHSYVVSYLEKAEAVHGLDCLCVRVETRESNASGKVLANRLLWLAPERNYLPVKIVGSWPGLDEGEETIVDDLRELKPGLWFPHHYKYTGFDDIHGKRIWRNQQEGFIEFVSLEPNHDGKFFADIPFAKDAVIFEVTGDKAVNITKQYHRQHGALPMNFYILLAIILVGLLVVGMWFWQRRRTINRAALQT